MTIDEFSEKNRPHNQHADDVAALTRLAYEKAGFAIDLSMEEVAALEERVGDHLQNLVDGVEAEDNLGLFLMEREFHRRAGDHLSRKIQELVDEDAASTSIGRDSFR